MLAGCDFNICGESLRTTEELGYALFDVDGEITAELQSVPGIIRVRVLQ